MSWSDIRLFFQQLFFLCQKELIALVKDPRLKFMLVVPPIMQGFLFGYAANYNLEEVPYAVIDESHGALAHDLIAHIDAAPAFDRVATLTNANEIADQIDSGNVICVVVIPQNFDRLIERGGQAPVQVIADGRNSSIAGLATGYISQIVATWNAERIGTGGITIQSRTWYDPNQETQWNFVPSLMAMISFTQVMLLAGMSIAKEREQGTFDQLLVTPLGPSQSSSERPCRLCSSACSRRSRFSASRGSGSRSRAPVRSSPSSRRWSFSWSARPASASRFRPFRKICSKF